MKNKNNWITKFINSIDQLTLIIFLYSFILSIFFLLFTIWFIEIEQVLNVIYILQLINLSLDLSIFIVLIISIILEQLEEEKKHNYILFLNQKLIEELKLNNKKIIIKSKIYNQIKINDIIYICEFNSTNHNINPNPQYYYCFNCAYKTWDIGEPFKKHCVPVIIAKAVILNKEENNNKIMFEIKNIIFYKNILTLQEFSNLNKNKITNIKMKA